METIAGIRSKNYQLWYHRQWTVLRTKDISHEFEFMNKILATEPKHYHAWAYRQWFLNHFGGWNKEMDFVNDQIKLDPFNNSAWNQRWQVLVHLTIDQSTKTPVERTPVSQPELSPQRNTETQVQSDSSVPPILPLEALLTRRVGLLCDRDTVVRELQYAMSFIARAQTPEERNNESIWNYIRGFFHECGAGYKYAEFPEVAAFAEETALVSPMCRCAIGLLVDICEQQNTVASLSEAQEVCSTPVSFSSSLLPVLHNSRKWSRPHQEKLLAQPP